MSAAPVSILICVHGKLDYTRRCLESLLAERSPLVHEIVVVDNASPDGTPAYLAELSAREPLVSVLSPGENLGFVGGNNLAAEHATGDLLVFLNNDTEPQPGWLEAMVDRLGASESIGAVGARLVYPDGRLQEAGGIVFADASGWNYGRGDDPTRPLYTFPREVDYCSGACLLVGRETFERLGCFDERYAPAYYEDTDLCFGVRSLGLRVVYEPRAVIVHHEGVTAGTDTATGPKAYQVRNRERFQEKWAAELTRQHPPDPALVRRASNRSTGARVLVVDPMMPLHDQASGSRRLHELLRLLAEAGHVVTFVARNGYLGDIYGPPLEQMGVEVYPGDPDRFAQPGVRPIDLERLLRETGYDIAFLSFYYIVEQYLHLVREHAPLARAVFDTVDVHHLRERREAELRDDPAMIAEAERTRNRELSVVASVDLTVTVTEDDRRVILDAIPEARVAVIPNVHDAVAQVPGPEARSGLLFVGNFRHGPNGDAARFLCQEVMPLVLAEEPGARLTIVGADPTPDVLALASPSVDVAGWVPEVEPYLASARVSVAPLRFGAGMKGKVGEALAHGVPVVTTPVGAEGMVDVSPEASGLLVADDAPGLAREIVRVLRDDALWQRLSDAGRARIDRSYGSASVAALLEGILDEERARCVQADLTSIVILARGERDLTEACIGSIDRCTPEPYELVLVDNGSPDETRAWFQELAASRDDVIAVVNRDNRGFAAGCNDGLAVVRGGTVLLLNNDTVVTPGWLTRMRAVLDRDPRVGIVGPVSNHVAGAQLIPGCDYDAAGGLDAFAARIAEEQDGVAEPAGKVIGFCLLARREVIDAVGGLDERFGSGNFEDDDLCFRALAAGWESRIARDAFVHHEGSRTFASAGIDHGRSMLRNWAVFKELWGIPAETALGEDVAIDLSRRAVPIRVPLQPLARTHAITARRCWTEDTVRMAVDDLASARGAHDEAEALRTAFADIAGWEDVHRRYDARRKLVTTLLRSGRLDGDLLLVGAQGLLDALDEQPAEPVLLNELGVVLFGLGEGKGAEAVFLAAQRLDGRIPGVADNVRAARELQSGVAPTRVLARSARSRQLGERARSIARRARPADGMRISLCMIVKDEEEMLARTLQAAAPAVDEIVVVDTGSTDRTVEIAESFGATVVQFPWNGSFADARNASIDAATGDWIFWLDADEVLAEGDAPRLRALARKPWREGFNVRFVNHLGSGKEEEGFVHTTMRLFRNRPAYRFRGRIHEQHTDAMPMHVPERFETTDIRVDHYGYEAQRIRDRGKSERNLGILEELAAQEDDPFTDFNLGTEYLVADRPDRAVEVLTRSWAADLTRRVPMPQYVPSLGVRLVQAHRLAGDPAAGLAASVDVLSVVRDHPDVVREAALCARALGDLDRAAELAGTCLSLGDAPDHYAGAVGAGTFLALSLLAAIRTEQGRFDEAEALLEQSLRDHPGYIDAAPALADVRAMRAVEGLCAAAVAGDAGLLASLLADPASAGVPAPQRDLYTDWLAALVGAEPALDLDAAPLVAALLDRLLADRAFDAFGSLVTVWRSSPLPEREQTELLAGLYLVHGFLDSAAEEWLEVAGREPDARALTGLARVAEQQGLTQDAAALATSALELDPTLEDARAVLDRSRDGGARVPVG